MYDYRSTDAELGNEFSPSISDVSFQIDLGFEDNGSAKLFSPS